MDTMNCNPNPDASQAEIPAPPSVNPDPELPSGPRPLSANEIDDLRNRAARADENWDRVLRLTAEFDNFKKRSARERQDAVRFANEGLLQKLIPVIDNFEMALSAATADADQPALHSFRTGVAMISNQLGAVLAGAGVEEINAAGAPFDPRWHEAVSQQDSTEVPEGHVLQQLRKGYKLGDRLLRPATVIVARTPAS